jgi:FkbM family methyltransferase
VITLEEKWWRPSGALARALVLANRIPIGEGSLRVGRDRLYASSVDRWLAILSWRLGIGENDERALIAQVVKPGMVAVDAGANVGLHTLGLARAVGPSGRVHAFEPDPENYRLLTRAVARARLTNVVLYQAACSDRPGTLRLYTSAANRGDHRTVPAPAARRSFEVPAVSLDETLAREPHVDFMKIDVQGAEVAVLRGFSRTLERNPGIGVLAELTPKLLELAGSTAEELFSLLRGAGLAPHRLLGRGEVARVAESVAAGEASRLGYVNLYFKRAFAR